MSQLQAYALILEPTREYLVPVDPVAPGADWYKREDVDKLLQRKQRLIELLAPFFGTAVEELVEEHAESVARGEPDEELGQLLLRLKAHLRKGRKPLAAEAGR